MLEFQANLFLIVKPASLFLVICYTPTQHETYLSNVGRDFKQMFMPAWLIHPTIWLHWALLLPIFLTRSIDGTVFSSQLPHYCLNCFGEWLTKSTTPTHPQNSMCNAVQASELSLPRSFRNGEELLRIDIHSLLVAYLKHESYVGKKVILDNAVFLGFITTSIL